MSIREEMIIRLLEKSMDLSLEELESLRLMWLKGLPDIDQKQELQHACNKFMDLVIKFKQEISEGEYAENDFSAG
ncbi:hypothetical protein AALB39_24605 [Lachnospiraceae bacterium 54-53]